MILYLIKINWLRIKKLSGQPVTALPAKINFDLLRSSPAGKSQNFVDLEFILQFLSPNAVGIGNFEPET